MANKYMKRCSTSPIITEMQNKTTVRYQLILIQMAIIKNKQTKKTLQTLSTREDGEKREPSCTVGENVN